MDRLRLTELVQRFIACGSNRKQRQTPCLHHVSSSHAVHVPLCSGSGCCGEQELIDAPVWAWRDSLHFLLINRRKRGQGFDPVQAQVERFAWIKVCQKAFHGSEAHASVLDLPLSSGLLACQLGTCPAVMSSPPPRCAASSVHSCEFCQQTVQCA